MEKNIAATSHHFVKHIGLPENRVMKVEKIERPEILADIEVNETEIFTREKSEFLKYNDSIIIFCDGCILQEKMGIGCWFGPKHPLNLSYHPNIIVPKDFGTNSDRYVFLSELLSVKMGLQRLRNSSYYNNEPVLVKTDSLNLIRSIERGYENYNFKGSFQEFVKEVQFFMERGIDVKFEFIGRIKKYENDKRSRFDMTGNRAVSYTLMH
uniref:RNase H type-1 domain-containing protein n=1 Tax=Acrobeloides nanus TaxID=290746 RepID=A0A914DD17_9BILA